MDAAQGSLDIDHCPFDEYWAVEAWIERVGICVESGGMSPEAAYEYARDCVIDEHLRGGA
jgi:hypothetical protein